MTAPAAARAVAPDTEALDVPRPRPGRPLRVLALGMNYAPEPVGVALYTTGLLEGLAARGHTVEIVAATPWYPAWAPMEGWARGWSRSVEQGVHLVRCPHPIPRRPSAAARLVQQAAWTAAAAGPLLARARRMRPDVVLAVAPALFAAPAALAAARACGARSWLHVQDFEAEAALGAGLLTGRAGRAAARAALAAEARILRAFDRVTSISPAMCARLAAKGVDPARIGEMRNWAEDAVRPLAGPSPYRAAWGLEDRKVALYSGNVGAKQGIGILLDAARRLRHVRDLAFVVCGEGPGMEALRRDGADLPNLVLRPLQPLVRLPELLSLADLHLMPQLGAAADLMLPSKLANMLASGRPVVATAAEGTQLHVEAAGCGLTTPPDDPAAFAAAIAALAAAPRMRASLGAAAAARARFRWGRESVIHGAEDALFALAGHPRLDARSAEQAEAEADAALLAEAARARRGAAAGA